MPQSSATWRHSPGRASKPSAWYGANQKSICLHYACLGGKDGKEMIWRVYFSILQIDRSHMLWQLATETDAPIRAVAKHGPKKGTFRYNFNFICTDFSSKKNIDSPTHYRHDNFAYSTTTHLPRVFKSLENTERCEINVSLILISWGDEFSMLNNLFESCHLGRSLQKMQKSFCNSPILQTTPRPVYAYIHYIQPLHLKQFQHLLRLHHTHFWWTLDQFRSMGPILGCICTRDNRALVLHMVVQLLRWDLCI